MEEGENTILGLRVPALFFQDEIVSLHFSLESSLPFTDEIPEAQGSQLTCLRPCLRWGCLPESLSSCHPLPVTVWDAHRERRAKPGQGRCPEKTGPRRKARAPS